MWLSFASLSSVYAVMLIGVYITASHQGLSCPEWPLCPSGFEFPAGKYFFEVLHRLLAVITGSNYSCYSRLWSKENAGYKENRYCIKYYSFSSSCAWNFCSKYKT